MAPLGGSVLVPLVCVPCSAAKQAGYGNTQMLLKWIPAEARQCFNFFFVRREKSGGKFRGNFVGFFFRAHKIKGLKKFGGNFGTFL